MDGLHGEPLRGSERGFDPRSHFLRDHPGGQLRYRPPPLLAACVCNTARHMTCSHITPSCAVRPQRVVSRDSGDKAPLSHSPG